MSVITKELLAALNTNINVTWQERFRNAKNADLWKEIAMPVNSKNTSEKYAFMGAVPGLREFKSERIPGTLSKFDYEITNKKFESTLDVDRVALEDDQSGQIMIAINGLATKAAQAYTKLICAAFVAGFSTAIYDGENFFDADHALGSNYLGTDDLDGAGVDAAELLLAGQVDDKGDPLGYRGTHIIVGPYNRARADALVNTQYLAGGASNPYYKRYEVIELPYLTLSNKQWALADLSQGLLPFIMQIRTPITLVSKTDINSDRAFDKDIYTWGTRARHNAGYGNHQLIVGAVNS